MPAGTARTSMTELSGEVEGTGLTTIVRFLNTLQKTGCLHVVHGDWQGEVFFDTGQVVGARLGSRHGLAALDALVQVMGGGTFNFDVLTRAEGAPDVTLSPNDLRAHLDDLLRRIASGEGRLPPLDAVPDVVVQPDDDAAAEPLPLDRLTLLTLVAVDGLRSVREIVAQRGSIDALWQLGTLAEVGLIRVSSMKPRPSSLPPSADPVAPASQVEPSIGRPVSTAVEEQVGHCPQLGFEDDAQNSFDRPTRLHRCFAAKTPLQVSIDQQRELCLSDEFGTCPRLSAAAPAAPPGRQTARTGHVPRSGSDDEDSRIVRLPFGDRGARALQRGVVGGQHQPVGGQHQAVGGQPQTVGGPEVTQLRRPGAPPPVGDAARPTPLRARPERVQERLSSAVGEAPGRDEVSAAPKPAPERRTAKRGAGRTALVDRLGAARVGALPVAAIAGAGVVLAVLGVVGYLLFPYLNDLLADNSLDASVLPNTSAVAAGEPVSRVLTPQAAPAAPRATPGGSAAATTVPTVLPLAVLTDAPTAAQAVPSPAVPKAEKAVPPTAGPSPAPASSTLLDDAFSANALNWPSSPQGDAWVTSGGYRLVPHQAKHFVSVAAPLVDVPADVSVSATFRKLGGPPGGGYGIILRNQGDVPLDGANQGGHFFVLEVGDKGEIGIWRRESDHWVDLLPWEPAAAVHASTATNQLTASAIGDRLSLSVNGTEVAVRTDATLMTGGVGLFAGGDDNQVVVEHVSVRTP